MTTERFEQVLQDIQNLKIRGAARIAKTSLEALAERLTADPDLKQIPLLREKLFATRPNEPMMRNLIQRFLQALEKEPDRSPSAIRSLAQKMLQQLREDEQRIAEIGARLLSGKRKIFTHCHSATVTRCIRQAAASGESLTVFCTETRPKYQGRITAQELSAAGIEVIHMVDSAALLAIQQVDLFLLGADAVLATGFFVNKVGSGLFALAAEWYHVPLYVVCHTLKFDPQSSQGYDEAIEERAMDEVWPERPEGVHILNPAFEKVPIKYVEAFVTERGLLNLHSLQEASQTFTV